MTSKQKKGAAAGAGIAAIFTAVTLLFFGISGDTIIKMDYELIESSNATEMTIYPPEELNVDIVELYCNGEEVTKTVLPQGKLKSIPFVFTDLGNLEIRLYKLNECIGIGNFKDNELYVAVKDGLLSEETLNEIGVTEDTGEGEVNED